MSKTTEAKYIILRKDLFPSQEALEKQLKLCVDNGLNLEEEIRKLINSGYIELV